MAVERITDVPEPEVKAVKEDLELEGFTVVVTRQDDGLFTVEGRKPDNGAPPAATG